MSLGYCSVSSFLAEFLKPRHPSFTPSLPWAVGINTRVRQHTNRTKYIQGTLSQGNWAEMAQSDRFCLFFICYFTLSRFPKNTAPISMSQLSRRTFLCCLPATHPCQMPLIAPSCSTSAGSQQSLPTPHSCSAALSTPNPPCRGGLVAEVRLPLPGAPFLLLALALQLHCLSLHFQPSPTWNLSSVLKIFPEIPPAAPVPACQLAYVVFSLSLADFLPNFLSQCCFVSTSPLSLDNVSRGIPTWVIWLA